MARKFSMNFRETFSKRWEDRDFVQPKNTFFIILTFKDT